VQSINDINVHVFVWLHYRCHDGDRYFKLPVKRMADEVYAKTEQERHSKEVEFVASHDGDWIKSFLQGVHEKRGFEAYKRLRDDVAKLWRNNGTGKN